MLLLKFVYKVKLKYSKITTVQMNHIFYLFVPEKERPFGSPAHLSYPTNQIHNLNGMVTENNWIILVFVHDRIELSALSKSCVSYIAHRLTSTNTVKSEV